MRVITAIRDFFRGYTDADIASAVDKLERHYMLPAGAIIPMEGREMRAIIGERLWGQFLTVRDVTFVNSPYKRQREETTSGETK